VGKLLGAFEPHVNASGFFGIVFHFADACSFM
jgi:hypothetical protein